MKLRQKDEFWYKGWQVSRMEANFQKTYWVASKSWNHGKLGTFRAVSISSFDSPHKIRSYVKVMNQELGKYAAPIGEDSERH